jgi:hypothetical protein
MGKFTSSSIGAAQVEWARRRRRRRVISLPYIL